MTVYRLGKTLAFPPPEEAEPSGLLAVGGDLEPDRLLLAYAMGIFPWYTDDTPILWFSPDPRGVLHPASLIVHRSLARRIRSQHFEVTLDQAFGDVIRGCAAAPRDGQLGTWITDDMIRAYEALFALGFAHSVETWRDGVLVGGLYGVSIGHAFFGESMFSRQRDASKVALVHLARQLALWSFELIDCQVRNDHLASLGAEQWKRERFLECLARCLQGSTRRGPWKFDEDSLAQRIA
ncbi:MAG: leucyl/phenylalanyl-tRNA--protein transferase [Candidatus Binatia bacterium]